MKKLHGLLALITLSLAASAGAAVTLTPAGTVISNTGYVDYTTDDNVTVTNAASNVVSATVSAVYGVTVSPNGDTTTPGQTVYTNSTTTAATTAVLTYTLTNSGNATDSFNLTTVAGGNTVAASVSYYLETSATPNGYTAGTDTLITSINSLPADGTTKTFYAVYTVPAGTAGGAQFDITPVATSVADSTKVDTNNLGRIIETSIYDFTFGASQTGTVKTPGTQTYTNTLTNTGNTAIPLANLVLTSGQTDTTSGGAALAAGSFTDTFTVTIGGTTYASAGTLAGALTNAAAASSVPVAGTVVVTSIVTAPAGRTAGDTDLLSLQASLTGVTTGTSVYNKSSPVAISDTTTVIKGLGTVGKTQALCGTSGSTAMNTCPASTGAASTGISVKPGDYVVYYLSATNSGTSNIMNTRVRDTLPANVSIASLAAVSTQAGTVLFSTNGTSWTASPTTLTVANGATVYAALDTDASGTITTADTLAPGSRILFRIKVRINDATAAVMVPQSDPQTVN